MERGPGRDQPDSIWAFHTWCDVWMMRSDLPCSYSGWQGTDPSRSYRDYRDSKLTYDYVFWSINGYCNKIIVQCL